MFSIGRFHIGKGESMEHITNNHRPYGIYEKSIKRPLDLTFSIGAIFLLSPLLIIIALLIKLKLGSPVIFIQPRPGRIDGNTGKEKIFNLYKFRTMTNECGKDGKLLPDSMRLTKMGKFLRSTSIDELPELFNVVKGDMSIIGPRPQLIKDMVFMNLAQRQRHIVRPGLSGLAQIRGRNSISWDKKLAYDLNYIDKITFCIDMKIIFETVISVFKREGITEEGYATALDYGDWLIQQEKISNNLYELKQKEALSILKEFKNSVA